MIDYRTIARELVARRQVRPVKWVLRCASPRCTNALSIEYQRVVTTSWDAREDLAQRALDAGWDISIRGLLCPTCYRRLEGVDEDAEPGEHADSDSAVEDGA